MTIDAISDAPPAKPKLSHEQSQARRNDRLQAIRLKMAIHQAWESRDITTFSGLGAALLATMLLGACGQAPPLPQNYRATLALNLVQEYARDGKGPPEITSPRSGVTMGGPATSVIVRYPVLGPYQILSPGRTTQRCITIERNTLSAGRLVGSRRRDGTDTLCSSYTGFERFTELESLAQQIRQCQERGSYPCPLSPVGNSVLGEGGATR